MVGRRQFWFIWLVAMCFGGLSLVLLWHWAAPNRSAEAAILITVTPSPTAVPVYRVCPSGCDFDSVQTAVDAAPSKAEIHVAAGAYTGVSTRAGTTQVVYLDKAITIRGGYNPDFSEWDPDRYTTVLDADGGGRVLYIAGGASPILEGLYIIGGRVAGAEGGGVYVAQNASPAFRRCRIMANEALGISGSPGPVGSGGGLYADRAFVILSECTFEDNTANFGGGARFYGGNVQASRNLFVNNAAQVHWSGTVGSMGMGGGLEMDNVYAYFYGDAFIGNTAEVNGGGGYIAEGNTTLINVRFNGNTARHLLSNGGGLYVTSGNEPYLNNVSFSGNEAFVGGGLYDMCSNPTLVNVTFGGNGEKAGNAIYSACGASNRISVTNSILWGTIQGGASPISTTVGTTLTVRYSIVQGGYSGEGNLDVSPRFVDPDGPDNALGTADDNLRLRSTSPALDAGDNAALGPWHFGLDQDGNPRFVDSPAVDTGSGTAPIADLGAYEYQSSAANNTIGTAAPLGSFVTITDVSTTISDTNWYVIDVPEPDSLITLTLDGLTGDYNLFLFAPQVDEATGQLRDVGHICDLAQLADIAQLHDIAQLVDIAQLADIAQLVDVAQLSGIAQLVDIAQLSDIAQLTEIAQLVDIGTLVSISSQPSTAAEQIAYDTHELYGQYYIVVTPHDSSAVGQPYWLHVATTPPVTPSLPVTETVLVAESSLWASNPDAETVILYSTSRLSRLYPSGDTITASAVLTKLQTLTRTPQVDGLLIDLDASAQISSAYRLWDGHADNPQAANHVARNIKALLYTLAAHLPDLKYLVIVGGDAVVPQYRLLDTTLVANERHYAETAYTPALSGSLSRRYFLTDDYYVSFLPWEWQGRELYIPQLAVGRLVEKPSEIAAALDAFQAHPVITPTDGLVTGYDFLIDQAEGVRNALYAQRVSDLTTLIDNTWTGDDLRLRLFTTPAAHDLNSLNSHFRHDFLYANQPGDRVYATEVTATTAYQGSLVFSVGCHSGLNVPDEGAPSVETGTDWPQAFLRQGATFIGNTGYGYGDRDLLAYSERLMLAFVRELGYNDGRLPTVGEALMRAKQRYVNGAAVGSLSNYDEKVVGELTLYGLPMVQVSMPRQTIPERSTALSSADTFYLNGAAGVTAASFDLSFDYTSHDVAGRGRYYTKVGTEEVHSSAGRPIQPLYSMDVHQDGLIAHGVLMTGGSFTEEEVDPVISHLVTDTLVADVEPEYHNASWYPAQVGGLNRFLSFDERTYEQLVVVPGQFRSAGEGVTGTQRLYETLSFEVYHAPFTEGDFDAPTIWQARGYITSSGLHFRVQVEDDSGTVARVVVLYYAEGDHAWRKVELTYDPQTGWAAASVPLAVPGRQVYYFVQAVDPVGNATLELDHGSPFIAEVWNSLYLPVITRDYRAQGPDLIVDRILAARNGVQVVVKNVGGSPVSLAQPFWVDVYIDPDRIPTSVNQIWQDFSREGLVWGVTGDLLPLASGESITLTVGDAYYWEEHSRFSGILAEGTPVYAQVDSANAQTTYGGVLETHEILGEPYNNISSVLSTPSELEISGFTNDQHRDTDARRDLPLRPGSLWRQ